MIVKKKTFCRENVPVVSVLNYLSSMSALICLQMFIPEDIRRYSYIFGNVLISLFFNPDDDVLLRL